MASLTPVDQGAVYLVNDKELLLVSDDPEKRKFHEQRTVVVVSSQTVAADPTWKWILVCPTTTSEVHKTRYDVLAVAGSGGLTYDSWISIPGVLPIRKSRLGQRLGRLDSDLVSAVHARLIQYIDPQA